MEETTTEIYKDKDWTNGVYSKVVFLKLKILLSKKKLKLLF